MTRWRTTRGWSGRHVEALRKLDQQFGRIEKRAASPAAVRDRRLVGPRSDAGCDIQAAQRLRARRARRAVASAGTSATFPAATSRRRWPAWPWARRREPAAMRSREERGRGAPGRRARLGKPRAGVPHGRAAAVDARGDRRDIRSCCLRCAIIPMSAGSSYGRVNTVPSHSDRGRPTTWSKGGSKARTRSRTSLPPRLTTCYGQTASRTLPIS